MLAGHPQLFCPPEVNLLFFEDLKDWRQNIGFGSEMEWTTGGLQWAFMELGGLDSAAGQALIDEMVAANLPAHAVYARLQAAFDRPKYIYLHRHPYPVMDSILRLRFDRLFAPGLFGDVDVDPHVVAETVWALSNRNLLAFFDSIEPERCHRVRYEDLVRDPAGIMTGVCGFLGLPFDERVLLPYDGKRERMMGGLGDPNILQHQGIDKNLGEAWKRIQWPRRLDEGTRALAARLGYELGHEPSVDRARAEELAKNLDQLSDEQVASLLAQLSAEQGHDA
jgi:phthiocerol/phenolphthiocerol synthesis type-I polyketide synthase E